MNDLYLSIHIPKTGGSTFRELLGEIAGGNLLQDYNDFPLKDRYSARRLESLTTDIYIYEKVSGLLTDNDVYIHGHFHAEKYLHVFPRAKLITWVRHPVQRLISHYHYWLRNPDMSHKSCEILHKNNLSIEQFSALDPVKNVMSKYIGNLNINNFFFIGITDHYNESIDVFKKLAGIKNMSHTPIKRLNPVKIGNEYSIEARTYEAIVNYNLKDMELYNIVMDTINEP